MLRSESKWINFAGKKEIIKIMSVQLSPSSTLLEFNHFSFYPFDALRQSVWAKKRTFKVLIALSNQQTFIPTALIVVIFIQCSKEKNPFFYIHCN